MAEKAPVVGRLEDPPGTAAGGSALPCKAQGTISVVPGHT